MKSFQYIPSMQIRADIANLQSREVKVKRKYVNNIFNDYNYDVINLMTKGGIREALLVLGNGQVKDIFINEMGDMIFLALVIEKEDWHWRFEIYHNAFKLLQKYSPVSFSWSLFCVELLPNKFGETWHSVLTLKP